MKLLPFAAAVCLAAFPAFSLIADDDENESVRTIPELKLEERIVDLLEAIEDEAPEIYRRMNELPREDALARIMRALDSGVIPASAAAADTGKSSPAVRDGKVTDYPVLELTEKHFLYIRFDGLTKDGAFAAAQTLNEKTGDGGSAPEGVVFDLRDTLNGDYEASDTMADAAGRLKCPVMVLVSGKTRSAGELLAAVLRRDCGAVLLGTETAGRIFPVRRIYVNDVVWFVPTPRPNDSVISPYALKPDLEKESDARLSFDELKEKPNNLDGDPVLRLAADLLTLKAAVKPAEQTPAQ